MFAFFKFERKWKLFAKKKKKNVIFRCELYACYELLTSWIQSLFQTIQLGYYQTTKKRNVQKQNGLSWNLLYQQGKNSCVIISIIRCLRNYFNHTMFKMTRKLCYKPVCNCDAHHTRLVEHSKIFMPCVGKTPSAKLVHSVCEDS